MRASQSDSTELGRFSGPLLSPPRSPGYPHVFKATLIHFPAHYEVETSGDELCLTHFPPFEFALGGAQLFLFSKPPSRRLMDPEKKNLGRGKALSPSSERCMS